MTRWILPLFALLACRASQQSAQPPTSDGTPVYAVSVTSKGFEPLRGEVPPDKDVVLRFTRKVKEKVEGRGLAAMVEPGRSIVGAAGVLLTRVLYRKRTPKKEFLIAEVRPYSLP